MAANLAGLTAVTLLRRYELDAAVAVLVVVPVHKRRHPLTGGYRFYAVSLIKLFWKGGADECLVRD